MKAEEMKDFTELNQSETTIEISSDNPFEQIDLKNIEKEDVNREVFFNTKRSRRIGNTWAFLYDKSGQPRIIIGPHCIEILM
jgi:hypothetical protein